MPTTARTCTRGRRSSRARSSRAFSAASGSPRSRTSTSGCRPIPPPAWPTSPAARATRRWRSRAPTRRRSSTGIDLDEASIAAAQGEPGGQRARGARRVPPARRRRRAARPGNYDLVYIHEALHDMSYPIDVLRGLPRTARRRRLADRRRRARGRRVPDPPGDEIERFYYGFSILHCLPVGMVGDGAVGTGTVMRCGHCAPLRGRSRVRRLRGPPDRERLLPLLPAHAVTVSGGRRPASPSFGTAAARLRAGFAR